MPRPAGLPKSGGRQKGSLNKITADVKQAAQSFTDDALSVLAEIMRGSEHPAAARVSAANAILDRGHGKPTQSIEASGPDGGPIQTEGALDLSGLPTEQLRALAGIPLGNQA